MLFLDIPNEQIVKDFTDLGIKPTHGWWTDRDMEGNERCCPVSCQLISSGAITLERLLVTPHYSIKCLVSQKWPDMNCENIGSFILGFDLDLFNLFNDTCPYFQKGRQLRKMIWSSEAP